MYLTRAQAILQSVTAGSDAEAEGWLRDSGTCWDDGIGWRRQQRVAQSRSIRPWWVVGRNPSPGLFAVRLDTCIPFTIGLCGSRKCAGAVVCAVLACDDRLPPTIPG